VPKLSLPSDFDGAVLSRDPEVGRAYRDDPLRVKATSVRFGAGVFAAMASTTANLAKITIPTYVLHGSADELVKPSASEGFERLPNATRVLHEGLRHESLNEPEKAEVLRGILDWVDAQLASGAGDRDHGSSSGAGA
jgi:alpha-beta hydrolase superfamily lysophospholipase